MRSPLSSPDSQTSEAPRSNPAPSFLSFPIHFLTLLLVPRFLNASSRTPSRIDGSALASTATTVEVLEESFTCLVTDCTRRQSLAPARPYRPLLNVGAQRLRALARKSVPRQMHIWLNDKCHARRISPLQKGDKDLLISPFLDQPNTLNTFG